MTLKDKVIIVTGGCGLIGREVVKDARRQGATVISVDLGVANRWGEMPDVVYDITQTSDIDALVAWVVEKYGRIDGLVNGAYPRTQDWGVGSFEELNYQSWQQNVDMQLNAIFYICQQVLKVMKGQNSGSIVNIGSIYGVVGNDFTIYEGSGGKPATAYPAIKGGVINLTRYLAAYFGEYGIRVNCMSPGGVFDNQDPIFVEKYSAKSPLKRMGNPEEMAPAVSFLLSQQSSFITGHNLMVDGGWTAI